ncbi:MAG: SBBP repeat-containing protein [Bryobacteraceae bacterium]
MTASAVGATPPRASGLDAIRFEPQNNAGRPATFMARRNGFTVSLDGRGVEIRSANAAPIRIAFEGANGNVTPTTMTRLPGVSNYIIGKTPSQWRLNVPNFSGVRYAGIYKGIDLVFYGNGDELEYDWVVASGADLSQIRMKVEGARSVKADGAGNLLIDTTSGQLRQKRPVIYQESGGGRIQVDGRFHVVDGNEIRFAVAKYDRSKELVIDPTLVYSTYAGGNVLDVIRGVAVDGSGSMYLTGYTLSTVFPYASATPPGGGDVFVAKLAADGQTRLYTTYIGGNAAEDAGGIAVDANGNAYISGYTKSDDFPSSNASYNPSSNFTDAFVVKLNSAGVLSYGRRLGGAGGSSAGRAIAINSVGNAFVAGETSTASFSLASALYPTYGGNTDAFVAKVATDGASLVYSTYLGGSSSDFGSAIAVDSSGNAVVGGSSSSTNFPATGTGPTSAPFVEGYVTKIASDGSAATYSKWTSADFVNAVAIDASGNAYVTGYARPSAAWSSRHLNATQSGALGVFAFAMKLTTAGAITYADLLSPASFGAAVAVDTSGNAYVAGAVAGSQYLWALVNPVQGPEVSDASGGFLVKLSPDGATFLFSTLLSARLQDPGAFYVSGVAANPTSGVAYVVGSTQAKDLPLANPFQAVNGASILSGFLSVIDTTGCSPSVAGPTVPLAVGAGTLTVQISAPAGCAWTVPSSVPWIHLTSAASGSGNGSATYSVDANGGAAPRYGHLVAAGHVLAISQLGTACSYSVNPLYVATNLFGGSGSFLMDTQAGCQWTLTSQVGWPTVSPSQGTGPTTIAYVADPELVNTAGGRNYTYSLPDGGTMTFSESSAPLPQTVAPHSAFPATGSGTSKAFAFKFYDPNGAQDFGVLNILLNGALDGRQACYLAYSAPSKVLYLVTDTGDGLIPGSVTSAGSVSNGNCQVSWSGGPDTAPGSTVYVNGNMLTLNLTLTFQPSFQGDKIFYLAGRTVAEVTSGWQVMGTFRVTGPTPNPVISLGTMSPARGVSYKVSSQTLKFNVTDTSGLGDLGVTNILINTALDARQACFMAYSRPQNVLYLADDAGTGLLPSVSLGAIGSVANSQCMVTWSTNAAVASGNTLTLTLTFSFASAFKNEMLVYAAARDQNEQKNTGWVPVGSWWLQ